MATKANLISTINAQLAAVVTVAKHRLSMLEVINQLFQTTTTITDLAGTDKFWYYLNFKKVGNIVYVDGYIQNKYPIAKSAVTVITIPNSVYFVKTAKNTLAYIPTSNGVNVLLTFSDSVFYLNGTLSVNERMQINSHYQTND